MLIQAFIQSKKASAEERSRAALFAGAAALLLGCAGLAALILLETFGLVSIEQKLGDFAHGFLFGISGGVIGAGLSTFISAWQRLHNPEKMRKYEIKCHDERNIAIQSAAAKMTLVTAFVLLYVMIVVSAFLRPAVSMALSALTIVLFFMYLLFIRVFSRKM